MHYHIKIAVLLLSNIITANLYPVLGTWHLFLLSLLTNDSKDERDKVVIIHHPSHGAVIIITNNIPTVHHTNINMLYLNIMYIVRTVLKKTIVNEIYSLQHNNMMYRAIKNNNNK